MERLDHLALKFKHKCDIHEAWTSGKAGMLKKDDLDNATFAEVLVSVLVCFLLVLLFSKFYFSGLMFFFLFFFIRFKIQLKFLLRP